MISYILGPTTPTFSLSEERSFDGSPKINIVFANGKSDTMILTKFDNGEEDKIETEVEECRYHKVASSNISRLEAHASFFRLLMKEVSVLMYCDLLTKS